MFSKYLPILMLYTLYNICVVSTDPPNNYWLHSLGIILAIPTKTIKPVPAENKGRTRNSYISGPFNLSITQFDVCKGPKQKDCASASASISSYYTLLYDISVLRNISPTKGKITAISNGKEFLRLQVKKTCEHLFLRPLFGALLNVTDECIVIKGHYQFTIDIQTIAKQYFGGTFLYGHWTFKSVFYSDECNFSCSIIEVTLFPLGT